MVGFGSVAIGLESTDAAAGEWLTEFITPWFTPTSQRAEWRVHLSSCGNVYARMAAGRPSETAPRACFAFDRDVISLPTWRSGQRLIVEDAKRSCFMSLAPLDVNVIGDPATRRWRFTSLCVLIEIAATRARRTALDLHAAAVETDGGAILIVGPKEAGKTTLSFHLLRSGSCRWVANDRAFASSVDDGSLWVRGVPTAVKIRQQTLADFPELCRGFPPVTRPYLYTLRELAQLTGGNRSSEADEIALAPAQVMRQLGVEAIGSAPLRSIVFPQIQPRTERWTVERLDPTTVTAGLRTNLYGVHRSVRVPTLFEQIESSASVQSHGLVDELSESVPAYRVVLGPSAWRDPDFAAQLLGILAES